jgi:hypothetical protein
METASNSTAEMGNACQDVSDHVGELNIQGGRIILKRILKEQDVRM